MIRRVLTLDPSTYARHTIHSGERVWAETNCYVDLWVELLHALGHEPRAALPFTLTLDFEGDQWTFFKFSLNDILELYGLEVQELAIWRPLVAHIEEQVTRGHPVLVELDSFYLPDTAGTAYQLEHTKTTVGVTEIDVAARHLGYFHNQGYFHLTGEDFTRVFRLDADRDEIVLPPYVEFVKPHPARALQGAALVEASRGLLRQYLERVPSTNPYTAFKARFAEDLAGLMQADIKVFHQYSFATLRQCGACFELAATYFEWLGAQARCEVAAAVEAYKDLANAAKAYQFQLARAMNRKKPLDLTPLDEMARRWEQGLEAARTVAA
ncbi:MAG: DUF1839 family protein [Gammaproteobacteria bacterium]|nr:DUF1839 family protein [Gammaproteobacteria bacterium]